MSKLTLEQAKVKWEYIFRDPLLTLTSLREKGVKGNFCSNGLRSVCWKLYLSYLPSVDTSTWSLTLHKERQHYADLRQKYITSPTSESDVDNTIDLSVNHPLSLDESNPWQQYYKDTELQKIIRQDVERTFPDNEYFRSQHIQNRLLDILFIYCKMNQDVSYRQGMHELLAPILWVVDHESLPSRPTYSDDSDEEDIIRQTLSKDFVEHDTFTLFSALMKAAKLYYEYNEEIFNRRPVRRAAESDLVYAKQIKDAQAEAARLTPVVTKCNKIHEEYLQKVDKELYDHLTKLEIEPQLYGIRWIRLLFGREFPLDQVLVLWDGIFAEDPTLKIVDFICVAMMMLIRDDLLASDYAGCLSMLMRYPQTPGIDFLVDQAKYLLEHLSPEGGYHIIRQNAIRAGKDISPVIPTEHSSARSSVSSGPLIEGFVPEGFVHVTKNVFDNRAINKAILTAVGAVGEVKKNVLRRPESHTRSENENRRRTSSTDFPTKYSIFNSTHHQSPSADSTRSDSQLSDELSKLREQSRQMAIIMQKSVDILEHEIFVRAKMNDSNNGDAEKTEKSSDGSTPRSSFEYIRPSNNEESATSTPGEVSILHALAGLKHVRDVLSGAVREFNPNVLDALHHSDDHWEVLDDQVSVVSVVSIAGEEDEANSVNKEVAQQKQEKLTSPAFQRTTSLTDNLSKRPLRNPSPPSPVSSQQSSAVYSATSSYTTSTPTVSDSKNISSSTTTTFTRSIPPIPKQRMNIDDVFNEIENSDPQGRPIKPKATIASSSKYSWMIEEDDNSLFNRKRGSLPADRLSLNTSNLDNPILEEDPFSNMSSPSSAQKKTRSPLTPTIPVAPVIAEKESGRVDPLGATASKATKVRSESDSLTSPRPKSMTSTPYTEDPLGVL
ncbi:6773_t:CDS:10 [Paraglomus brasilianum]|uniref:6773_t:CDS:1 n=1 Tax=Paraglomus brasilianum TaxID=144538 RepID=A0A9N9FCL8_9GLOM|nr:6773_t:CDS:10 [Paraglomus brasilianum]